MLPFFDMQLDVGLVFAAIAGAGTVLGTLVAAEKYMSAKFQSAVVSVLRELEYDRKLRHMERDLNSHSMVLAKLQDVDVDLEIQIDNQCKDLERKIDRAFAVLSAQKIAQARLESAARVLGSKLQGDASITAILTNHTEG